MFRWYFYPVGDDSYLTVAATALALLALLALVPVPAKAGRTGRRVLWGLRLAAVALVVLAMLRPTLILMETKKQSATLPILIDATRSMSVRDELNGRSRWEALEKALADARDALRSLGREIEIKPYLFDVETHPADFSDGNIALAETPDGRQTAIGAAIEDVLRQEAGKRLVGMLLLSDGAQRAYPPRDTLPQAAADRLKRLGYPLFTVRFGQSRGLGQEDVAITELVADPQVFVKNELTISGQVRIHGYLNRELPVKLLVEDAAGKMQVVDQKSVKATADGQRVGVQFVYVPQNPGEFQVRLEVEPQPGERVTTNNSLSTFVHVLKGGLQVLYLEGALRWEKTDLVKSLAASPDIRVRDVWINLRAPERPAGMSEWFQPGKFDVYILGDLDSTAFRPEELAALEAAVDKGAGLIMLGGFQSFGAGGYAETPLAKVLPVVMNRLERQPPTGPINESLHILRPVRMRPTPVAEAQGSLRLAATAQESAAIWAQLPPLDGANKLSPKAGAPILATTDEGEPLLVSQPYGAGRVMAFAGDSTWRWVMHGFESAHKRFWRQTILWLAKKDESREGNVWIKLPQRRFDPGQRVEFTAGARSPTGELVKNAAFQGEIQLPDGSKQPLQLARREAEAAGACRDTLQPGSYRIVVTATADGNQLGSAQARFLVSEQDLELDNAQADPAMLENLAAMTRGQVVVPEGLSELLQRLTQQTETVEVHEVKRTFWDTWPYLLLVVGLLGTEWYLRKRWGLV